MRSKNSMRDDIREASYLLITEILKTNYPIFKGQNKQRIEQCNLGYQSREQKKRGESNHIRINLTQTEPTPEQFTERKEASVFGWTVSAFSPHKTDNTHTQNNALLLLKRETEGLPSSREQSGAAQPKQGGANKRRGRRCLFFFEKEN